VRCLFRLSLTVYDQKVLKGGEAKKATYVAWLPEVNVDRRGKEPDWRTLLEDGCGDVWPHRAHRRSRRLSLDRMTVTMVLSAA